MSPFLLPGVAKGEAWRRAVREIPVNLNHIQRSHFPVILEKGMTSIASSLLRKRFLQTHLLEQKALMEGYGIRDPESKIALRPGVVSGLRVIRQSSRVTSQNTQELD